MGLRIVIGADSAAVDYKEIIKKDLEADERVEKVIDIGLNAGEDVDYPHVGIKGARMVAAGEADRALLLCGTGIGMAIVANKVPGIRASVGHDSFSVERLIKSNNGQVLTMGQRVIGIELARRLVKEWLGYEFDPQSNSARKVQLICDYEVPETDGETTPGSCS